MCIRDSSEPDIYNAIKRNALLENVTLDAEGHIDFADKSFTENLSLIHIFLLRCSGSTRSLG